MSERSSRRGPAAALAAAGLAAVATGCVLHASEARSTALPAASLAAPTTQVNADDSREQPGTAAGSTAPPSGSPAGGHPAATSTVPDPSGLSIGPLGISMSIVPKGVQPDGQMAIPANPATAGWYRFGPKPGDRQGSAVVAAHIDADRYGVGPFAKLAQLRRGDRISIRSGDHRLQYRVQTVTATRKTSVDLGELFARTGPPRLHLVTCGGTYDRHTHHYRDNIVVDAIPLPS